MMEDRRDVKIVACDSRGVLQAYFFLEHTWRSFGSSHARYSGINIHENAAVLGVLYSYFVECI
jgi:hypothetical protein